MGGFFKNARLCKRIPKVVLFLATDGGEVQPQRPTMNICYCDPRFAGLHFYYWLFQNRKSPYVLDPAYMVAMNTRLIWEALPEQ